MPHPIRITVGDIQLNAQLNDSETARKIYALLPLDCSFNTWGDEIYFAIPLEMGPEDPHETVSLNELGYWPPGHAFCIFYGLTPASRDDSEIRPASPVNLIGQVLDDAAVLKSVSGVHNISVEAI